MLAWSINGAVLEDGSPSVIPFAAVRRSAGGAAAPPADEERGDDGGGDDDEAPDGLEPTAEGGAELGEGEDEPWWGSHSPWLPSGVYAWHAPSRGTAEVALALPAPK